MTARLNSTLMKPSSEDLVGADPEHVGASAAVGASSLKAEAPLGGEERAQRRWRFDGHAKAGERFSPDPKPGSCTNAKSAKPSILRRGAADQAIAPPPMAPRSYRMRAAG